MTRILHVIDTTGPGGAETIFVELARAFNRGRWESIAVVPGPGWVRDALGAAGLDPVLTPLHGAFDFRYLRQLVTIVRRRQVGLIQTHLPGPAVYGALAGWLCRVPVVSTFHGQWDLTVSGRFVAAKFNLIRRTARRVVFVSDSLRRDIWGGHGFDMGGTVVVPNGIDITRFTPRRDRERSGGESGRLRTALGIPADAFVIGAVGNLRPEKCYDVLLRAAAILRTAVPESRVVIVGEEGEHPLLRDRLYALRAELGLDRLVHFTGYRQDVDQLMREFDAYVSTSGREGFSLTTVEALACGVPVVATRSGGPEEILTDQVNGFLVEVGDATQIAGALARLRRESNTRCRLIERGLETARGRFGMAAMVSKYEAVYEESIR